ncbi:choline transporter-like protein 1 [Zophobas morio]|uniref:choline transporter-like protein 1 n=1 Tax=Zophobas morio TaxID=2755281 RepID=UPI0030839C08
MPIPHSGDQEQGHIVSEAPQNRTCTDTSYFIAIVTCCLLVIPFCVALSMGSDINRFIYGYDRFGNTCGVKNKPIYGINCSGKDLTNRPIARLKYYPVNRCMLHSTKKLLPDVCVDRCIPPNKLIFHRCYPAGHVHLDDNSKLFKNMTEIFHAISESIITIVAMALAGLVLSLLMFVCLRWHHTTVIFWAMVIFQLIASATATSLLWLRYGTSETKQTLYLLAALGAMVYFFFIVLFVVVVHDAFPLITRLYDEAIAAIFRMPTIMVHLLTALVAVVMSTSFMIFLLVLIFSNQCLQESDDPLTLEYTTTSSTFIFACYVIFVMLWVYAFAEGWQCMITAGSVGQYYLARDKSILQHPVRKSYHLLTRYHLGTVACGSLFVTALSFMRYLANYFVRKVFALTALHGQTFQKSSVQLTKLMILNWFHAVAITGFHYILKCGFSCLILLLTVGLGTWMHLENIYTYYTRVAILCGALIANVVACFVMQVLSVSVDTVFLCFCEEQAKDRSGDVHGTYLAPTPKNYKEPEELKEDRQDTN